MQLAAAPNEQYLVMTGTWWHFFLTVSIISSFSTCGSQAPNSKSKIAERGKLDISSTHIHDGSFS
jgi:hypothetical protein